MRCSSTRSIQCFTCELRARAYTRVAPPRLTPARPLGAQRCAALHRGVVCWTGACSALAPRKHRAPTLRHECRTFATAAGHCVHRHRLRRAVVAGPQSPEPSSTCQRGTTGPPQAFAHNTSTLSWCVAMSVGCVSVPASQPRKLCSPSPAAGRSRSADRRVASALRHGAPSWRRSARATGARDSSKLHSSVQSRGDARANARVRAQRTPLPLPSPSMFSAPVTRALQRGGGDGRFYCAAARRTYEWRPRARDACGERELMARRAQACCSVLRQMG